MTLQSTTNRVSYIGNGATATFEFPFLIFEAEDLLVTVADLAGAETTLVLNTDYSLDGVNTDSDGGITLIDQDQAWLADEFLTTGYTITLRRVLTLTQSTSIRNQGPFFPEIHEDTFDRLTMVDQQLQDGINRSLVLPESEAGPLELPPEAQRANKFLAFDADGEPIASDGGISDAIPVSAFMETLLDDTTAAAARTTLGFAGAGGTVARSNLAAGAVGTPNTTTKTATYSATADDDVIFVDTTSAFTLTLPSTVKRITVQKTTSDTNALTITGVSLSTTLNTQNESVEIVYNGSAHVVTRRSIPGGWVSFTPTGSWSANSTYTGRWRRTGDSMQVSWSIKLAGAPTSASLSVNMPAGFTIDTAKIPSSTVSVGPETVLGVAHVLDASTKLYPGVCAFSSSSAVVVYAAGGSGDQSVSQANPITFAANDAVSGTFTVPVTGWNG